MSGSWIERGGSGAEVSVFDLIDEKCQRGVLELIDTGALVSFSLTSDHGALGITVTVDGEYRRDYFRSASELGLWLAEAVPAVQELRGGSRPPAGQRTGPRRRKRP